MRRVTKGSWTYWGIIVRNNGELYDDFKPTKEEAIREMCRMISVGEEKFGEIEVIRLEVTCGYHETKSSEPK